MMDQVEEIKSKVDIVEVISSYIPLKKMGRNFGGLCPFHGEKTPSFMVSPERQSFKCFGCAKGGDVFTFLEELEGWDFRETLEELAKRAGVKLRDYKPTQGTKVREKLIEIHSLALKFYTHILNEHKLGEVAREYLLGRGIKPELWKKFDLGYAPDGWENTFNFLKKRKFEEADVALSGLVIGREKGAGRSSFYDRFRGRIMFPMKDSRGTVLGFSGRVLAKDAKEAKYINSPETPIFSKGNLLFGLNAAKEAIRDKNETVLVEGEFDVISAHGAGVTNTVASKGTALTEKQVAVISRLCENVAMCFDMDLAGDAASRRGIEMLDMAGMNIKVVRIAGGKDPDELAQKNPAEFKKAVEGAMNVYDYLIESALKRYDARSAEGKRKIGKEILPVISKISDELMRAHYITKLSKSLELDVALISDAVSKKRTDLDVFEKPIDVATGKQEGGVLEEYFMALFLAGNDVLVTIIEKVEPTDFESEEIGALYRAIRDIISDSKPKKVSDLVAKLPTKFAALIDRFYFVNISPSVLEREVWAQEMIKVVSRIKRKSYSRQVEDISNLLAKAQKEGDEKAILMLTRRFDKISALLGGEEKLL
ncbi:DNA primase [Candidatus Curtissbacteria bacterium]|nr:DNA primase [Candidatus Curtissbacteria bacterium]